MAKPVAGDGKIRVFGLFGGSDNQITAQQVRRGRVCAVFGGSDIDLRGATIADQGATITIISIFGSVRFLVPEDWAVNVQTRAVFGGIATQRSAPTSPVSQLTLTGLCLFGGVKTKS